MKFAYKTEIKPTKEQAQKIKRSIGICRWLYNQYIEINQYLYKMHQRGLLDDKQSYFMTANDFDKYVNNKLKVKKEYAWINKCGSKARKKVLMNAEAAFKNFFAGYTAFPSFKSKVNEDVKLYFPKNNLNDWTIERHRIKIPTLKYVRLKEYGYLPTRARVINGNVSYNAGKFYVSITVEEEPDDYKPLHEGIGLDIKVLDIQHFDLKKLQILQKRLYFQKRRLHRKYKQNENSTSYSNKEKQREKIKRIEQKIVFIREDYLNKSVAQIMKLKPKYIIIENFNVKNVSIDKNLKKYVIKQRYYDFKNRLLIKCNKSNIELRQTEDLSNLAETIIPINII